MGSCTSIKSKKHQGNTLIVNNQWFNSQKKPEYNYQMSFSNPLQLIITETLHNTKSTNVTIILKPRKTIKELNIKLKININSEYDIKITENQIITNINKKIIDILYPYIQNINNFK